MSKKLYTSDEDKIMQDKSILWSEPAIVKKDTMKTFTFEFVEEVTSQVEVKAETEAEARKKVEEGNFSNDEIMERDHFEITNSWEGHKSSDTKQPNEGLGVWNGYEYVKQA